MLKNIIKPNENILMTCQAFVQLFAGLNEAIPASFSFMSVLIIILCEVLTRFLAD